MPNVDSLLLGGNYGGVRPTVTCLKEPVNHALYHPFFSTAKIAKTVDVDDMGRKKSPVQCQAGRKINCLDSAQRS